MQVSNCFLECNGKFLVVSRPNPRTNEYELDLPAAIANADETPEAVAIRVVLEETGYKIEPQNLQPLGTFDFVSSGGKPYTMFTYRAEARGPFEVSGSLEGEWVSAEECIARHNLIKNLPRLLALTGYTK